MPIYWRNALATDHIENGTASQGIVSVVARRPNDLRQTIRDEFACEVVCELGNAVDIGDTSWGRALALPYLNSTWTEPKQSRQLNVAKVESSADFVEFVDPGVSAMELAVH